MSYSSDPVLDASRYFDSLFDRDERINKAWLERADMFVNAALSKPDANAICTWAPMATDWDKAPRPIDYSKPVPKRYQTMSEIMLESLDYKGGPDMSEAMQLIMNLAAGTATQAQAHALIRRMAEAWADHNEVEE